MSSSQVTIVDYGAGNILSVQRSLENFNAKVLVTSDAEQIINAEKLILPGVGAFPAAMRALGELQLVNVLQDFAASARPMMAICLGMQLLMESSTEQVETKGLGIFKGKAVRIPESHSGRKVRVPHVGWNAITPSKRGLDWERTILRKTRVGAEMYFVHSYMVEPENESEVLTVSDVDGISICGGIANENVTGLQFHPEKSSKTGLAIVREFLETT